jgi:fatty acid desaturase
MITNRYWKDVPGFGTYTTVRKLRRFDVPTLTVAISIFGGYLALTYFFRDMPLWLAAPLCAIWLTWYGSLQHETIHDHPTPWRRLNMNLGSLPLALWIPYRLYRLTHLEHHRHGGRHLTDAATDPESFYLQSGTLSRAGPLRNTLYLANCTLAGRLLLGPLLVVSRFWTSEARKVLAGNRRHRIIWIRHGIAAAPVLLWTEVVCHIPFLVFALLVVYPSISLNLLRSFAEHRAHQEHSRRTLAVEANPLWALLFLNNNLHIAHHAHPELPWHKLPGRWREMRGRAAESGLVLPGGYRQVVAGYLLRPVISVEHPAIADDK